MDRRSTLVDVLLHEAEDAYSVTRHLFHLVSDSDLEWKPATGKNWMTVGQLLMHCAAYGCGTAVQGFITGNWGMPVEEAVHLPEAHELPRVESVAQALSLLSEDRELTVRHLGNVNPDRLLGEKTAAPWGGPELTLFQHLLDMIAHLVQHKGQLFYYLKLMGRDVNTGDLWGGADPASS